jgi:hypothetical protein
VGGDQREHQDDEPGEVPDLRGLEHHVLGCGEVQSLVEAPHHDLGADKQRPQP